MLHESKFDKYKILILMMFVKLYRKYVCKQTITYKDINFIYKFSFSEYSTDTNQKI